MALSETVVRRSDPGTHNLAISKVDAKLTADFQEAQRALSETQKQLESEESTLAAATAQFNEQCLLQARGEEANPQIYRESITRIEHRILGLKSLLSQRQSALDLAAQRRNAAIVELTNQLDRARLADVLKRVAAAEEALKKANAEVQRATLELREAQRARTGELNQWSDPGAASQFDQLRFVPSSVLPTRDDAALGGQSDS